MCLNCFNFSLVNYGNIRFIKLINNTITILFYNMSKEDQKEIKEIKEIKAIKHLEYMNDLSKQLNNYKEKILKDIFNNIVKPHKDNKIKDYKEFKKNNLKLNREDI